MLGEHAEYTLIICNFASFFELRYAKGRDRFRLGQHSEAIRQDAHADTSRHAVHVRHDSHRRCFHRTWGRKRRAGGSEHILAFLAPDDGHRNDAWHRMFGRVVDSPVPGQCQGRENQHDPDIDLRGDIGLDHHHTCRGFQHPIRPPARIFGQTASVCS